MGLGHIKVVMKMDGKQECFGRVAIKDEPDGERKARDYAAKIVDMHTNRKGDKGGEKGAASTSSRGSYEILFDADDYPLKVT